MEALGAALARHVPDLAQEPALLYLSGELGAGKTTLARGLLAALGARGPIRSPSFTLVETYALEALTVWHVDLYRLRETGELDFLGLRDAHTARQLWIVEWPEHAAALLPEPDLHLQLSIRPDTHHVAPQKATEKGAEWLRRALR
jgi:tRNA threonylcarbamoyladenosine biosynthesis protein TsaE